MSKPGKNTSAIRWVDGLFVAALLAHVPMGIAYSQRMWRTGHYQFFPLLMIVAGWLMYDRVSKLPPVRSRSNLTYGLLGLNVLILTAAVLLYSPLLWILSFLFLIGIFIFDRWGWNGVQQALPAWLLLLFIVPLPKGLDVTLITKMQFMASQLASWILDAFGQIHFREGVVLITEKKQFFTEEACSGIRSLFSSMAAISIYGVMRKYPLWRHVFNLCQTVIWVIVGNAIRVAIVVYVSDNWYAGIASGTAHEMLGLVVFLFIFFLALSTDRAINAWQTARLVDPSDEGVEEPTITVVPTKPGSQSAGDNKALKWGFIALFAVIALFGARLTYAEIVGDLRSYDDDLVAMKLEDMPANLGGWERVDAEFENQIRDEAGLLAPESFLWTYRKEGRKVIISLDSPYYDFHPLKSCYSGLGWKVKTVHQYKVEKPDADDLTFLSMTKKNEFGIVFFSAFDRKTELVIPPSLIDWRMELKQNLSLATKSRKELPISQIQLIQTSSDEIANVEECRALFLKAREILLKTKRFSNSGS